MHIIAPHMSCAVRQRLSDTDPDELQEAIDAGYREIYLVAADGIFKHHKLRDGADGLARYVQVRVSEIPGLKIAPTASEIQFLPAGKVPMVLFNQIVQFFKQVMTTKKNELEAMAMILWNQAQGYHVYIPDQRISKASVHYDWNGVPAGSTVVVDIHSHNTMGAFFSGTDNADDRNAITFSGVVGKINDPIPATVWRFNYRSEKYDVKLTDIFEVPQVQVPEIPEDWVSKVQTGTTYPIGQHTQFRGRGQQSQFQPGFTPGFNAASNAGYSGGWQNNRQLAARQGNEIPIGGQRPGIPSDSYLLNASDEELEQAFGKAHGKGGSSKKEVGHGVQSADRGLAVVSGDGFEAAFEGVFGVSEDDEHVRQSGEAWDAHVQRLTRPLEDAAMDFSNVPEGMSGLAEEAETREVRYSFEAGEAGVEIGDSEPVGNDSYMYEAVAAEYGPDVADAYVDINDAMVFLEGHDGIAIQLISDMIGILGDDSKGTLLEGIAKACVEEDGSGATPHAVEAVKAVFDALPDDLKAEAFSDMHGMLPERIRDKIATYGF